MLISAIWHWIYINHQKERIRSNYVLVGHILRDSLTLGMDILDILGKICIPLFIVLITFVIARKQIINTGVTQFRQKWIDNLRDAISLYIAKAEMISILDLDDEEDDKALYRAFQRAFTDAA